MNAVTSHRHALPPSRGAAIREAILRAQLEGAQEQLRLNVHRERAAFAEGLHRGRAAWPLALLVGAAAGAMATLAGLWIFGAF